MHLAQLNIARLAYPHDDPRVAEFMDNLDRINAIAERSPGFVWRHQDESGNATGIALDDDPLFISNLSVWERVADLQHFVWNTLHRRFYERRAAWFQPFEERHFVMWRVPVGHLPDLAEARGRLAHLNQHGPSEEAFGWESVPATNAQRAG